MRGATQFGYHCRHFCVNFNPHSPCGERPRNFILLSISGNISIHTPHAGSDQNRPQEILLHMNFNPHSPCGERPAVCCIWIVFFSISIHTPHAGSDGCPSPLWLWSVQFQSTLPMRGATSSASNPPTLAVEFQSTLPMRGATLTI